MNQQFPKRSRFTEIRVILEAEIERGDLVPGAILDERALAVRFNVSRTPVREALQQLVAKQYVQIVPRQGVFVTKMSVPQLRDMLELLSSLEIISAQLAARRMDDTQSAELRRTMEDSIAALEAGDVRRFAQTNVAFHNVICDACHNEYLADQIRSIRRMIARYHPKLFLSSHRREQTIVDHKKIVQALLAGDEAAAEAAMARHSPGGETGFSEFLATLPSEYFSGESVSARHAQAVSEVVPPVELGKEGVLLIRPHGV